VVLDGAACVHLHGKGRKLRSIPLWDATVAEIRSWLRLNPTLRGETALLPNRDGQAMSRSNVAQRLDLAVSRASVEQPSLLKKHVSPHILRHYVPFLTMSCNFTIARILWANERRGIEIVSIPSSSRRSR
jgi:site-specific recombinase XerC